MIRELVGGAHSLDHWLKLHVGRPYTALLITGLAVSISASVKALATMEHSTRDLVGLAGASLLQSALLVNQLAQLHEYREAIRLRREARRRAGKDPGPAPPRP